MGDMDWTGVIFGMGVLILGTIIVVVVLIVAERFYRARAQREDLLKLTDLVKRYEQSTTTNAKLQESATAELVEVRKRLDAIERMLNDVG